MELINSPNIPSRFAIVVCPVYEDPADRDSSPYELQNVDPFTWSWLSTINRVNSQVQKVHTDFLPFLESVSCTHHNNSNNQATTTDACTHLRDDPRPHSRTPRRTLFSRVSFSLFNSGSHCPAVYPSAYARLMKVLQPPLSAADIMVNNAGQALRNLVYPLYKNNVLYRQDTLRTKWLNTRPKNRKNDSDGYRRV